MDHLDHLGWVVELSCEVGDYLFGVRTNSEACGEWLEETLGEYAIDDDLDPYYSLFLAEDRGVGRPYHIVYSESRPIAKTHDLSLLARAFLGELESLQFPARDDAVYVQGTLVGWNGLTALVPTALVEYVEQSGRRVIERAGLSWPLPQPVAVDMSGRVVPTRPLLHVPADAPERLAALVPANGRDPQRVVSEPTRVDLVVAVGLPAEPLVPVSRAMTLYYVSSWTRNLQATGGRGVEALRRLVEGARCYELQAPNAKQALESLVAAFRDAEDRSDATPTAAPRA
jgi:hypothetical protein